MTSYISWLDFSVDEQERIRELLKMFEGKETVDDLGIGSVRDRFSNLLFPGTSIIQTRARYFLFIPWLFQWAERHHPHQVLDKAEDQERRLIQVLKKSDDTDGLIGAQAGESLKMVPSAIYWNGMSQYGIFRIPGLSRRAYSERVAAQTDQSLTGYFDDSSDGQSSFWDPEIPPPPPELIDLAKRRLPFDSASFMLTFEEAQWLQERMLTTDLRYDTTLVHGRNQGPQSLLTVALRLLPNNTIQDNSVASEFPWDIEWKSELPSAVSDTLYHAEHFSLAAHGVSLLYNLLLAQLRFQQIDSSAKVTWPYSEGGDAITGAANSYQDDVDFWHGELSHWYDRVEDSELQIWAGHPTKLWSCLDRDTEALRLGRFTRISPRTRKFMDAWLAHIAASPSVNKIMNRDAEIIVRKREMQLKGNRSRFRNQTRLAAWNGASGAAQLSFRWTNVQRILDDIGSGLARGSGSDIGVDVRESEASNATY